MPVTAKLSKAFYDRVGEQAANELVDWFNAVDATYRADLRELNDRNFALLDAKLEQRFEVLRAQIEARLGLLQSDMDARLSGMDGRFARTATKDDLRALESKLLLWMVGLWIPTGVALVAILLKT